MSYLRCVTGARAKSSSTASAPDGTKSCIGYGPSKKQTAHSAPSLLPPVSRENEVQALMLLQVHVIVYVIIVFVVVVVVAAVEVVGERNSM
jgi:hypothetical protein